MQIRKSTNFLSVFKSRQRVVDCNTDSKTVAGTFNAKLSLTIAKVLYQSVPLVPTQTCCLNNKMLFATSMKRMLLLFLEDYGFGETKIFTDCTLWIFSVNTNVMRGTETIFKTLSTVL